MYVHELWQMMRVYSGEEQGSWNKELRGWKQNLTALIVFSVGPWLRKWVCEENSDSLVLHEESVKIILGFLFCCWKFSTSCSVDLWNDFLFIVGSEVQMCGVGTDATYHLLQIFGMESPLSHTQYTDRHSREAWGRWRGGRWS